MNEAADEKHERKTLSSDGLPVLKIVRSNGNVMSLQLCILTAPSVKIDERRHSQHAGGQLPSSTTMSPSGG